MQVRYYSHATFQLTSQNNLRLLADPWAFSPIYGNMHWQFPECPVPRSEFFDQDAIYISHEHPDHFCLRTLELFAKSIPVIIRAYGPEIPIRGHLERLGFTEIIELDHRQSVSLDDMQITLMADAASSDSLIVASDGHHTVIDQNDCVLPDSELDWLGRNFSIDLGLLFYSSGSHYPACFEMSDDEKAAATDRRKSVQMEMALDAGKRLGIKSMIPCANDMLMFRCPQFDPYSSSLVAEFIAFAEANGAPFDVLPMVPGDTYTFRETADDYRPAFADREAWTNAATDFRARDDIIRLTDQLEQSETSHEFDEKRFQRLFERYCDQAKAVKTTLSTPTETIRVGLAFDDATASSSFVVTYGPEEKAISPVPAGTLEGSSLHLVARANRSIVGAVMSGALTWEDLLNGRWFISRPGGATDTEFSFWEFLSNFSGYLENQNEQPALGDRGRLQRCHLP